MRGFFSPKPTTFGRPQLFHLVPMKPTRGMKPTSGRVRQMPFYLKAHVALAVPVMRLLGDAVVETLAQSFPPPTPNGCTLGRRPALRDRLPSDCLLYTSPSPR